MRKLRTWLSPRAFGVADVDNGMLLLRTSGDANESPINLANVAASHPDMFSPHVGVEVSVGFYQAIDRGIEELSATDNPAEANPATLPTQTVKPENRLSIGREASGRKAAVTVAATALAGALLWCGARKHSDDEEDAKSHHDARPAN